MDELRFNTAIAKLIELTNALTPLPAASREAVEPLVLMMSPFAPHLAEELWRKLGHDDTLAYADFPVADPAHAGGRVGHLPGAGQRQGPRPGRGRAGRDRGRGTRGRAGRRSPRCWPAGSRSKVIVVAGPPGQRRRLTGCRLTGCRLTG